VLLLLALVLFGCGIWWGLPGRFGWAGDELHPTSWGEAISWKAPTNQHEWHLRYPPLHFAVLQGTSLPLRWLINHGYLFAGDTTGIARLTALIYFGRFISLIMALATLVVLYRVGREIYDHRSALFTVLITMCIAPYVYYAKMGNLDVPYVLWFALSLLFYVRILKQHRLRDYVLFAAAAAAVAAAAASRSRSSRSSHSLRITLTTSTPIPPTSRPAPPTLPMLVFFFAPSHLRTSPARTASFPPRNPPPPPPDDVDGSSGCGGGAARRSASRLSDAWCASVRSRGDGCGVRLSLDGAALSSPGLSRARSGVAGARAGPEEGAEERMSGDEADADAAVRARRSSSRRTKPGKGKSFGSV